MKIFSIQNYNANQQSKVNFQGGFTSVRQVKKPPVGKFLGVLTARGVDGELARGALSTEGRSLRTARQNLQKHLERVIESKRRPQALPVEKIVAEEPSKELRSLSELGTATEKGATKPVNMTVGDFLTVTA